MNNLQTYEEFDWKTGVAGLALAGTLAGGMTSCCSSGDEQCMITYNISKDEPFNVMNKTFKGEIISSNYYCHHQSSKHHEAYTKLMVKVGKNVFLIIIRGDHEDEIFKGDNVKFILRSNGGFLYKDGKSYVIYPFAIDKNKSGGAAIQGLGCDSEIQPLTGFWGGPSDVVKPEVKAAPPAPKNVSGGNW